MKRLDLGGRYIPFQNSISSLLLALILFFYILTLASFFNPTVYPLIDRVTYSTPFAEKYFLGKDLDQVLILSMTSLWLFLSIKNRLRYILSGVYGLTSIAAVTGTYPPITELWSLLSFPLLLTLLVLNKLSKKQVVFFEKRLYINLLSGLGVIIGFLSLIISGIQLTAPDAILPSINYMYYMYLIFSIFSPIALIIIGLSFPIKMVITRIINSGSNLMRVLNGPSSTSNDFLKLNTRIMSLSGIIILSLLIVWIPHMETVNKDDQVIGSDTNDYAILLENLNASTTVQEFANVFVSLFSDDRPLSLVTFFILTKILDPSNLVNSLELLPFVLAPLLVISIYIVTMELTSNHFTAIMSSFMTAISFHVLVGIYGGLYANWFTLIFVNLSILFLMRSLRVPSKMNITLFSILLIVVLFSHEPTWPIVTLVLFIFLTTLFIVKPSLKKRVGYLLIGTMPSFMIELFKTIFIRQSGVIKNVSFASSQGLGVQDVPTIWNNLVISVHTYLAGQFSNSIIFGLVIYWVLSCTFKDKSNILIIIFLSIVVLPILFGDPEVIGRVLYEIPFQIPAAVALTQIKKKYGNIFFFSICLWLIALSIRTSTNFYFDIQR